MKKSRSSIACGLGLAIAAGAATAQTAVNGPYYATPSWDQSLPASSRFLVLSNFNNEAVLDRETGLVWQRSPSTVEVPFANAFDACFTSGTGGRSGWRLPTVVELYSLLDPAVQPGGGPAFPRGHPFTGFPYAAPTEARTFWSTTVYGRSATSTRYAAGYVASPAGIVGRYFTTYAEETDYSLVFCVRGGGDPGAGPR